MSKDVAEKGQKPEDSKAEAPEGTGKLAFELMPVKEGTDSDLVISDLMISEELRKELLELPEDERLEVLRELAEDLQANLEGEEPEFPQIKILHSAAMFETPNGEKLESVQGITIEILPARAWWEPKEDTERVPPECASRDWIRPDPESPKPQAETCAKCQWNVWGSAVDPQGQPTRGKACRMRKRIFLQQIDHEIPYVLSVPPKSLKALRQYLVALSDQGIQKNRCETKFTLDLQEDGVQEFSVLVFEKLRELSLAEYRGARKKRDSYLGSMRAVPIGVDEFVLEEEAVEEETSSEESAPESGTGTGADREGKQGKDDLPF